MAYDFQDIEKRWKKIWAEKPIGMSKPAGSGKKYYCLDMFPYPSGSGLHVGHWRGYVLSDLYARKKWLEGYNVLHPMGWDAFGLPAENDAIKKGMHPKINTAKNIARFKEQLQDIGAIYDWSKEVDTTDANYYKWTQWIFLVMFKRGLAYESNMPINWCPSCLTGLANEEVVDGACERCGHAVEQRNIRQWVLKITEYAQKLLDGLDTLEWPEKVKAMQRNWIGKSEGLRVTFKTEGKEIDLPVYTTRPDTIFGVSFIVIAPEHEIVDSIVAADKKPQVDAFRTAMSHMTSTERTSSKEKLGVFTGSYAINPADGKKVPIYLANFVLADYGTGMVMGVPAGDERDLEFAQKYNLPIIELGDMPDAQEISQKLIAQGVAERMVSYKLRDWIFSRQRYWGEPIPLIHCPVDGIVPVPENQLPVMLPEVDSYQPTGTGESPLAAIDSWVNTSCPKCGGPAKRETNTMPQWAGSCWYFLRYPNPALKDKPFDKKDMEYWLPVDLYVGGIEHAILHLLYARFYTKVLHDAGYVPFSEPFTHLFNQGMVLKLSEKSGLVEKMSKSKGNVVSPDEVVAEYGSDAMRLYTLFMGPPELDCIWQDSGLAGMQRFLKRLWDYLEASENRVPEQAHEDAAVAKRFHKFLKQYQERLEHFKPNTAISAAMEWLNDVIAGKMKLGPQTVEQFLAAFSIMTPFMSQELMQRLFKKSIADVAWPSYDAALAREDEASIAVQVNGKVRAHISVARGSQQQAVEPVAREAVAKWLDGAALIRVIFVADRLINFVIKQ